MADRKTEGYYNSKGEWVTSSISKAAGADDTSMTTKARLQDAKGLGSAKSKPWPKRADFDSDEAWQKAYDARRKEQTGTPVSAADPMDETEAVRQSVGRALGRRYGGSLSLGRLMGRG